jgi:O-antigen/teichoic acid export membrane protein
MLGHHIGLSASGIYTIAFLFGTVIAFPSAALAKSASVFIAEAWKTNDLKTIEKIYKNSCIIQFLVGILIFVGIAANLHNAFQILRPEYRMAENVIYLIGFTKLVDMATGVNGMVISTSKYYIFDTISFMILTVVTVILNLYLIPLYGVEGAGLAALITMSIYNFARYYFLYLKYGFQPFNLKFIYVAIIGIAVYYSVNLIPKFEGNTLRICLDVCFRSIFIIVTYLSLVYFFKISAETNGFLRNGLKKALVIIKK